MHDDDFVQQGLLLKEVEAGDLSTLVAIEQEAYPFGGWRQKHFEDSFKNCDCWLICTLEKKHAEANSDNIVGYFICQQIVDEYHIDNLCIHVDYQRRGWGKLLLNTIIERAIDKSCSVIHLEVRASNKPARKLYRALGFNEIGRRKGYYPAKEGREDARLLSLLI